MDASAEVVEIHRGPAPGGYGETRRLAGGATVSPQAFPDIALPLVEMFPQAISNAAAGVTTASRTAGR